MRSSVLFIKIKSPNHTTSSCRDTTANYPSSLHPLDKHILHSLQYQTQLCMKPSSLQHFKSYASEKFKRSRDIKMVPGRPHVFNYFDTLNFGDFDKLLDETSKQVSPNTEQKSVPKRRYIDKMYLKVRAGNGGNGCKSFLREKFKPEGPPSGGSGGRGGDVVFVASDQESSFADLKFVYNAEHGGKGLNKNQQGKNGTPLRITVPVGTVIKMWDAEKKVPAKKVLVDLDKPGQTWVAARGGQGGRGNSEFATSINRSPRDAEEGTPGEERTLFLELKTIADVGLVGYPNAGKSTLLSVLSNATPKIAPYPFTTLHPQLGVLEYSDDYSRVTVADLPGLIEGAHANIGLGHEFLRHIERTKVLCYVLDMSGEERRNPWDDYFVLQDELRRYNSEMLTRPCLIVANKMDAKESTRNLQQLQLRINPNNELKIIPISAKGRSNIEEVKESIRETIRTHLNKAVITGKELLKVKTVFNLPNV